MHGVAGSLASVATTAAHLAAVFLHPAFAFPLPASFLLPAVYPLLAAVPLPFVCLTADRTRDGPAVAVAADRTTHTGR